MTNKTDAYLLEQLSPPEGVLFQYWQAHCRIGSLTLRFSNGSSTTITGGMPGVSATLLLRTPAAAEDWNTLHGLDLAGSYADDQWNTPDLTALLFLQLLNQPPAPPPASLSLRDRLRQHLLLPPLPIEPDLAFVRTWLDGGLNQTAGVYKHATDSLEAAQYAKYQRILDTIKAEDRQQVLELGCGWGGFTEHLLKYSKTRVHTLATSHAQQTYTQNRLIEAGVHDRAVFINQANGRYDHIVALESPMLSSDKGLLKLKKMLKPGGRIVLQCLLSQHTSISIPAAHQAFLGQYLINPTVWPPLPRLQQMAADAYLQIEDVFDFGQDYARTLRDWRLRFVQKADALRQLGFDAPLQRRWLYGACWLEACFLDGRLTVAQITLGHDV